MEKGNWELGNQQRGFSCTNLKYLGLQMVKSLQVEQTRSLHMTKCQHLFPNNVYLQSFQVLHSKDYHRRFLRVRLICKYSKGRSQQAWFLYQSLWVSFLASSLCVQSLTCWCIQPLIWFAGRTYKLLALQPFATRQYSQTTHLLKQTPWLNKVSWVFR